MSTPTTRGAQSVNSILQTNHRERLFVPPLRWTDRHLQLLGCSFVAPPERDCRSIADALPDEPRGPIGALISSADVSQGINAARIFALGRFISAKYDGICLLLSYPGSALKTSRFVATSPLLAHIRRRPLVLLPSLTNGLATFRYDSLWFQFGQRSVSQLPCLTFTFRPKTSTKKCGDGSSTYPLPCLAFLTLTEIGKRRRKSLRPHLGLGQKDRPTFRIYQRNLQKLTPAEPLHDAYIAALLIALAQARRASQEEDDRWNGARGQSARAKTKVRCLFRP